MTLTPQNINYLYCSAFITELARAGVENVVICPGSRSTPLAMTFAYLADRPPRLKLYMHIDERSAAFFALGMAKASGKPTVILCTSGTAAANFLPAVTEAYFARVPLIILTADRPSELREIGAAQTIDQVKLYGRHVRFYAEMSLPEATPAALRYVQTMADRAVTEATTIPYGPVHLNFPFREPLVPIPPEKDDRSSTAWSTIHSTRVLRPEYYLSLSTAARLMDSLRNKRGLIICGMSEFPYLSEGVWNLAAKLHYPVLADPISNCRYGVLESELQIDAYDCFLRDEKISAELKPEVIIRFGMTPTSKPLNQYMSLHRDSARHFLIDPAGWNDPTSVVTDILHVDPIHFCDSIGATTITSAQEAWIAQWAQINQQAQSAIDTAIAGFTDLFEGAIYRELAHTIPDETTIMVSSSMPVRDMDTFFAASDRTTQVYANRGANGIDGITSTALGIAAVTTTKTNKTLLITGDLAFYHDMNGLLAAKIHGLNLTIILINNSGGGIFSFLPQAEQRDHFEMLYGTPTGLDFAHAAALYGADYHKFTTLDGLGNKVTECLSSDGLHILEVVTADREANVMMHREIWLQSAQKIHAAPSHIQTRENPE